MTVESYLVLDEYVKRTQEVIDKLENEPTEGIEDYYNHLRNINQAKLRVAAIKRDIAHYEYCEMRRKEAKIE